jgi:hypothetical protein
MIWMDVDTAVTVPVNVAALLDDTDFKTRETGVAYNASGMDLVWNFMTTAGVITQTAVTPTTGGSYDWTHSGDGMYKIEIPASGGASINNDTEGYGWFTGICTGVLPWAGPMIGFRASGTNDLFVDGTDTALKNAIADAILLRDVSNVEASAGEHTLCTVVLAMLEHSISGTTLTIKRTNGSTTHATKTITTDAAADPITGIT